MANDVVPPAPRFGKLVAVLTSSWTLFGAIAAGILAAKLTPWLVPYLRPVGEAYISLLKMTIIPFAASATIAGLAKVMREHDPDRIVRRMIVFGAVLFLGIMLLSMGLVTATRQHIVPSAETNAYIGQLMFQNVKPGEVADNWTVFEIASDAKPAPPASPAWVSALLSAIPANVFQALSEGEMVKILVFFAIFALTARYMSHEGYHAVQAFADGVFAACVRILDWLYILAAPGIASFIADTFVNLDIGIIWRFKGFIGILVASLAAGIALSLLLLWIRSGHSLREVIGSMLDSLFMAGAANSELLAMPKAMEALHKLGFDSRTVNIVMPIGVNLIPNGAAAVFAVASVYCAILYKIPLGPDAVAGLCLTLPLAAVATIKSGPLIWYGFLSIPLKSLGIPAGPVLVVLYAVDFLVDRLMSILAVSVSAALVGLVKPAAAAVERTAAKPARTKGRK